MGVDLEELLGDWLGETALPGFVASEGSLVRLVDDENGLPQYQFSVHLRNEETAPGLVRLSYTTGELGRGRRGRRNFQWDRSAPIRVPAGQSVEIGLVTQKAPRQVSVAPYISLNRTSFAISLPAVDEEKIVDAEPLEGARPSDWQPRGNDWIVVDDLDPGFSVEGQDGPSGARLGGSVVQGAFGLQVSYDRGLPVQNSFGPLSAVWSRWVGSGCCGCSGTT